MWRRRNRNRAAKRQPRGVYHRPRRQSDTRFVTANSSSARNLFDGPAYRSHDEHDRYSGFGD
ncbi:MAG: hypothetical protein KJN73_06030 [Acidimicrobiia bacterium]|nr:hypothetical protein [Acidimicrobiia bacterium]NNJ46700.1 hypothetical protein [Acidimicrobiia bacterium]